MASMSASGPVGAWEIASTRIPPFIYMPNEHKSSGGGLHWVATFMRNMHEQVLTCWWQSHYPNWLSPLYMYSWYQSSAVDANHHTDKILYSFIEISNELHQYHQIHCSSPGQTPFRKVFRTDTFHLPYKYNIKSEPT